jgi:ABC-type dipeptide/oligopeptide/nickel transport system ATPase component
MMVFSNVEYIDLLLIPTAAARDASGIAREREMSMLFISHDLLTVSSLCSRIAILHGGEIVECGAVRHVLETPQHPYTQQLVAAVQWISRSREAR